MSRDEFDRCMAVLIAAVGRPMTPDQTDVWRECLSGIAFDVLKRGITASIREWKFAGFPPIGFVADRCGMATISVSEDQQAVIAWDTAFRAISKHGGYVSVAWDDSAIPAAIETVAQSWATFCEIATAELIRYVKPKFIEAWKAHRAAGTKRDSVSLGILARDAGRIGGDAPEPVRIGERQPAVIGFGSVDAKALPAPEVRRLTVAGGLAAAMSVPDDESELVPVVSPKREPASLPTDDEWRENAARQRHFLTVKYGTALKGES